MPSSAKEMQFYHNERPILVAQGMTDYDEQCKELKRRWDLLKTLVTPSSTLAPAQPVEVPFDAPLDKADLDSMSLVLSRVDTSDVHNIKYIYVQVEDVDAAPPGVSASPLAKPSFGKRKAVGESSSAGQTGHLDAWIEQSIQHTDDSIADLEKALASAKRSKLVEPAPTLGWLLSNVKKDTLQNICEDLKVSVSGNKDELMMRITEAALQR